MFAALTTICVSAVEFNTSPYTYNGESGVTITGFNGLNGGETVTIPAEIDGKPVLAIGLDGVVTTICIPGAKKIGGLDLTQADNLKVIEKDAFFGCENLKGTIKSDTVEVVGDEAFYYNCSGLTSLDLPSLTTIGDSAFCYCSGLTRLNLLSLTTIEDSAFCYCSGLTRLNLPSLKTIGDSAFNNCSGLTSLDLPSLKTLGDVAFSCCSGLEYVYLNNCTKIGDFAFWDCPKLQDIYISYSCEFSDGAFVGIPDTCLINGVSIKTYLEMRGINY